MAPVASDPLPGDDDVSVQELVFSCCICQATVTDVYAMVESNQGFHSGSSNESCVVTKMWITSCSHVTCSKHLQDGAVPFHPRDQQPQAPCPKCIADKNDDSPKDLFSVQGLQEGQYDPTIPEMWMHCPAIKLDDSIPGIDAVRFQYMALCHYGRQVRKHWKAALKEQSAANAALSNERKARKRLQSEQFELQTRVAALQKMKAQVKKWEDRKPIINHYMKAFPEMAKDNERMRRQLIELGFDVPMRKYLFEPAEIAKLGLPQSGPEDLQVESQRRAAASVSAGTRPQQPSDHEHSSSARKRKRDESFAHEAERNVGQAEGLRANSRDMMPPPLPRAAPAQQLFAQADPSSSRQQRNRPQHSTTPYDGNAWKQQRDREKIERYRDLKENYRYLPRERQSQLDTSIGRQYPPLASHQYSEPQNYLDHSGYTHQPTAQIHHYDPVSLAQLSLQSSSQDDLLAGDQAYDQAASNYRFASKSTRASHNLYRPPHNMLAHHVYGHRDNTQPNPVGQFFSSDHRMVSKMQNPMDLGASQSNFQKQLDATSSPFFKRGVNAIRPDTVQRPPARGNDALTQFPGGDGRRSIQAASRAVSQTFVQCQDASRSYHMNDYQPAYPHRQIYSRRSGGRQQSTAVPQTQRNPQGLFQRPDRPAHSSYHSPTRAEPLNYGRRITLPPSTGPSMLMPASQDEAISQIRGVRGASSYGNIPGYQPLTPSYNVGRQLFSTGPRQSLRR